MTAERISKTQRWLDLLAFLLGRRTPATVEEIFAAVPAYRRAIEQDTRSSRESVRRMFERDKDELRTAGIPIESERFLVNFGADSDDGYRLRAADFYLPRMHVGGETNEHRETRISSDAPFEVAAEDLEVTLAALREAADIPDSPFAADTRSALRKLSFDLDPVVMDSPVLRVGGSTTPDIQDATELLSDALLRRKRVTFSYHSPARERPTDRDVAAYGLMFERGAWYLIGHDAFRDDIRVFRVDRMETPVLNRKRPGTPDYEIPTGFSLALYRDRRAWQYGDGDEPVQVRVRFSGPLALWAEKNGFGQPEENDETGGRLRTFEVYEADPFIDWVLGLGGGAVMIGPPALVSRLLARAEAVGTAHEGEFVHGR
ncbi:MAG: WYL domain-containing protein [Gemmatimonadota bacterium]